MLGCCSLFCMTQSWNFPGTFYSLEFFNAMMSDNNIDVWIFVSREIEVQEEERYKETKKLVAFLWMQKQLCAFYIYGSVVVVQGERGAKGFKVNCFLFYHIHFEAFPTLCTIRSPIYCLFLLIFVHFCYSGRQRSEWVGWDWWTEGEPSTISASVLLVTLIKSRFQHGPLGFFSLGRGWFPWTSRM